MDTEIDYKYNLNLTLIGDSNVGKTTIKDRLLGRNFNYKPSSNTDIISESLFFTTKNNMQIRLGCFNSRKK